MVEQRDSNLGQVCMYDVEVQDSGNGAGGGCREGYGNPTNLKRTEGQTQPRELAPPIPTVRSTIWEVADELMY